MDGLVHWNKGDVIVFRGVSQNKIWYVLPVFVVQDTPTLIALYWPSGTRGKFRMKPSGERVTPQDVILTPMDLIDRAWDTTDVLMLITPGAAHAVYVMWAEGQKTFSAGTSTFRTQSAEHPWVLTLAITCWMSSSAPINPPGIGRMKITWQKPWL